jgi:predicted site-specific integrase-resolvase
VIPENVITQKEAAERLGVSRVARGNWRKAGKGPPVVMIGNRPHYDATEVEAFVAQRLAAGRKQHQRKE